MLSNTPCTQIQLRGFHTPSAILLKRLGLIILLGVLGSILCSTTHAEPPIAEVLKTTNKLDLGPYIEYACETNGPISYPDAFNLEYAPLPGNKISFGYYPHPCWFRFALKNTSDLPLNAVIQFKYSLTDHIEVYSQQNGLLRLSEMGDNLPFASRPLNTRLNAETVRFAPLETVLFYTRVTTTSTFTLPIEVSAEKPFLESSFTEEWILGIFYGISLGLMAYNFFLFLSTRETAYIYYVLHVLSVTAFFTAIDGISFQWWPNAAGWQNISVNTFAYSAMLFGVMFAKHYLNVKPATHINRICNLAIAINVLSFLALALAPYRINAIILPLSGMLAMLSMMAAGIVRLKQNYQPARVFVLAWIVFLIMVLSVALNAFGVISALILSLYGLKIGFISQQILLSVGMGNRINQLKDEMLRSQQSQIEAKAESRAKSDFLAKMSHEIRTPMNGVLGMAQLLKDTPLNPSQFHYVNTIHGSGQALLGVINDILDYSKIEAGKMELEKIPFNLENLLNECASMFSLVADEKKLTLVCAMQPGLPTHIKGDPTRLRQIILNLLGNAFKFTETGEVVLRVLVMGESSVEPSTKSCDHNLRFEISDSGIGMSEDVQKNLFQSFHQADTSTTRKYGGTGLGLAISQQLVNLMEGEIGVESTPNVGTTFWFTIPVESVQAFPEVSSNDIDLKGKRVLIVDDNPTFCEIMSSELISWGMLATIAYSGHEALKYLEQHREHEPFDLLSIDIDMPKMNGLELCRRIQKHPVDASTPKMLLTAARLYPNNEDLAKMGVAMIIEKPISSSLLRSAFSQLLFKTSARESSTIEQPKQPHIEAPFQSIRVLVADDNEVNRMVISGMLKKLGATSENVVDGAKAFEAYKNSSNKYDLILMDCEMPEMDGFQTTQAIRKLEQEESLPTTPIIALTAHVMKEQQDKCMAAGMDDHLAKPIEMELLVTKIRKWIEKA